MSRIPLPTSMGSFRWRLSAFDAGCALVAPILALAIPDALILSDRLGVLVYWITSGATFLLAFAVFRLDEQLPEHFSRADAWSITKACVFGALLTAFLLFLAMRLDGIPRSTLLIHAALVASGLMLGRVLVGQSRRNAELRGSGGKPEPHHVVLVGANRLSAMYVRMLQDYSFGRLQVVAVLDDRSVLMGRSIAGVPVAGPIGELGRLIDEFSVHGVGIDRVILAGSGHTQVELVRGICERYRVAVDVLPDVFGVSEQSEEAASPEDDSIGAGISIPRYIRLKRPLDVAASATMIVILAPLWIIASILALADVGSPVLFWQRRVGHEGRNFFLLKIRTLRAPYDRNGNRVPEDERLSPVGRFLRRTHVDELPQLLNVLRGDMSIIGPRPLLPRDQPNDPSVRLLVRPGITGWAQVNGGTLLTPEEKHVLDEWYIRNASLGLDLKIILLSLMAALQGPRRPEPRVSMPRHTDHREPARVR